MLDVIHVYFDYPEKPLLQNVHFTVARGQLLYLRGKNGAGKTTLLKLLAGLFSLTQGDIHYRGESIHSQLGAYQKTISFIGHKPGFSALLSVSECCRLELGYQHHPVDYAERLQEFALADVKDIPAGLLSAGQRRRLAILRLILKKSSLWLIDEPLVGLDTQGIHLFQKHLAKHLEDGGMVVLTSHQSLEFTGLNYQEYNL